MITLKEANDCQTDLLAEIMKFRKNRKPKSLVKKKRKRNCS